MEKNMQPQLRFKEFSGNWEEKKLGEVLTERKVKQKISEEAPLLAFASGQGVIDRSERKTNNRDFLTKDSTQKKYLLTKYDDIVYNPSNLKYGAIDRNKHGQGVISPIYVTFETNEIPCFIELIVKMENFKRRALQYEEGTVTKRQSVKPESLLCLSVTKPRLNEQEKIALFFSTLNSKIEELEEKKELLGEYKKGIMQKIFSQEIRFKDENGDEYPQWENKTTDKIAKIGMGFTPPTKDSKCWNGEYKWLSIADMKKNGKYVDFTSKFITDFGKKKKTILPKGTLIMSFKLTLGRVGILKETMYTNEAICNFKWINNNMITEYAYYYLDSINVESFGSRAAMGVTLNTESLNSIVFKVPCREEQEKIADFLTGIDQKIEFVEKEIDGNKEFKKGLLQQMFV